MAQEIGSEKPVIFSACGIEDYTRELNRRFVSCMKDLENLETIHVHGAIIGKALYVGAIDLEEAAKRFS